jgi:hypothetical protein
LIEAENTSDNATDSSNRVGQQEDTSVDSKNMALTRSTDPLVWVDCEVGKNDGCNSLSVLCLGKSTMGNEISLLGLRCKDWHPKK